MDVKQEIKKHLNDKRWRITSWKLYKIKNKNGELVPFVPNKHQIKFFEAKQQYNNIVIPKARQLWFTTAEMIRDADDLFFRKNINNWFIADKLESAKTLFNDKLMVIFNNLPDWLKEYYVKESERANLLSFQNTKSSMYVDTSFRWWTLQNLHVSEYAKVCYYHPERSREIKTGAFETVGKGNKKTVESTAMWSEWDFYNICMQAKEIQDRWLEPNEMERKLLFFPRWQEKWYRLEADILIPKAQEEYFKMLELDHNIILDQQQKNWYYMKRKDQQDDMLREYPSFFEECFQFSIEGNYYVREINVALKQWRIWTITPNHQLRVHTAWDLWWSGWWDDTTVWFFQVYAWKIYIIDYFEDNIMSWQERLEHVKNMWYNLGRRIWPHDIHANFTGKSRRDMAYDLGIKFETIERSKSLSDDIQLVKKTFPNLYFDEKKCYTWLEHLKKYRRAYSEKNGIWLDRPEKNGADHAADSLRYLCLAFDWISVNKEAEIISLDY